MKKNIIFLLALVLILVSCWKTENINNSTKVNQSSLNNKSVIEKVSSWTELKKIDTLISTWRNINSWTVLNVNQDNNNLETYVNGELWIKFNYNKNDYTNPVEVYDKESDNKITKFVKLYATNNTDWTANPNISIKKIYNKTDDYITTYANEYLSDWLSKWGSWCDLIKDNFIKWTISRWVKCSWMWDSETVLIKNIDKNFIIEIESDFSYESFNNIINSIEFIK